MNILIANLGVSDLTVRIGEFFFPVDDRKEPNQSISSDYSLWGQRRELLKAFSRDELGFEVPDDLKKDYFKEITKFLLSKYQQSSEQWHSRMHFGRVEGVLYRAINDFKVDTVYLVVTDQRTDERPDHHPNDTIYLFKLLKLWFEASLPELKLKKVLIRAAISPIDQDGLLQFYYDVFKDLSTVDLLLVGSKGGTPQMGTALKIQALASGIPKTLFIESDLSIEDVMNGRPSHCHLTSYWKFAKSQRVQTIKQLLRRWDFDGARELVRTWQNDLREIQKSVAIQEEPSLELAFKALTCVCMCTCLDRERAKKYVDDNPELKKNQSFQKISNGNFDEILNLYAQCKICQEVGDIPDFLWRMSSYYEGTLNELFKEWSKRLSLQGMLVQEANGYFFMPSKAPQDLCNLFEELESPSLTDKYKLESRSTKRNLVEAIIKYDQSSKNLLFSVSGEWTKINQNLQRLDYWANQRNQIIHNVKGVSYESMAEILVKDRNSPGNRNNFQLKMLKDACNSKDILDVMGEIYQLFAKCLRRSEERNFNKDEGFYIYSDIRNWIIEKLEPVRNVSAISGDP